MSQKQKKIRSAVRRDHAESYLLISLVSFAVSVIATRVFLELTGYPQLGDSVLHIAHALWGGLLLFIAALLPLALINRWAIQASAVLGGVGIGLFIDEVGKFITQANDYFFPPALSIVYAFFLLTVLVYIYFRRPRQENPRKAMYHVLEGLKDALDGDLDQKEAAHIKTQLAAARSSDKPEIHSLAGAITSYMEQEKYRLLAAEPSIWKRAGRWFKEMGHRLGRKRHRILISAILILWLIFVIGFILVLFKENPNIDLQVAQWKLPLIFIQVLIGILTSFALIAWLAGNEETGLNFAGAGFLLSLVALQTLYFYLSQFSALTATLIQFVFLLILIAYRRWYLIGDRINLPA